MLTRWDDYFVHQTHRPLYEPAIPDPRWMERCYWNVQSPDGRGMIGLGLGQYRVTGVMDAVLYVVTTGEQRILRLSRHLVPEQFALQRIGPLALHIREPMSHWTWHLDENPSGIAVELDFLADSLPVEFAPFAFGDGDDHSLFSHFVQLGRASGRVTLDGRTIIAGSELPALRDRSWGTRRSRERQGLHLWLHHSVGDIEINVVYNEARDGSLAYLDGYLGIDDDRRRVVEIAHDLAFVDATRDVDSAIITFGDDAGRSVTLVYERLLAGYVGGVGYGGWAGVDRGEFFLEYESLDLRRPTATVLQEQPILLFDHLCRIHSDEGAEAVGSFQMGITRSDRYRYQPSAVRIVGDDR